MGNKTIDVTCPVCGNTFAVTVRRHNKMGEGGWDADKLTELDEEMHQVLHVIDEVKATSWETGRTRSDLTFKVNTYRNSLGLSNIKPGSVSRSCTMLQGLKVLSCRPAEVFLTDPATRRFEHAGKPRWYRVGRSILEDQA